MGRLFGLFAVLSLMVLVIEFTPGCYGRALVSKRNSHHHHNDGSGDHYPPPPNDDDDGSDDNDESDGSGKDFPPPSYDGDGLPVSELIRIYIIMSFIII